MVAEVQPVDEHDADVELVQRRKLPMKDVLARRSVSWDARTDGRG
jgi:hypothetical protein